ncbi:MAG: sensor domain-containing protein, partial [Acidimicrobiales bacterium]|nr:sensor domain-containing protein [Acidimicrobiales bacterium]
MGALHASGGNVAYRGAVPASGTGLPWRLGHLLGPLVSARTWLAQVYLLANVPLGIVGFVVVIVGVTLGIGLSLLALLGLGIIALDLWACRGFARLQRATIALMLGVT